MCLFLVVQPPSRVWLFETHGLHHSRPPCPSPSPQICPSSCPLHWRCPLLPSMFPIIREFSNQSALRIRWPNTGASASPSVLPRSIQAWFPLRLTGLIFLLSKGLCPGPQFLTSAKFSYLVKAQIPTFSQMYLKHLPLEPENLFSMFTDDRDQSNLVWH